MAVRVAYDAPKAGPNVPGGGVLKKSAAPGIPGVTVPKSSPNVPYPTAGMFRTPSKQTATSAAPSPAQAQNYGAYGSGGTGFGAGGAAASAPVDSGSYLGGDAQYQLQLAALQKAAADEQADITNQTGQYNTQYTDALKQLGYEQPDPTQANAQGAWEFGDTNTAAGRAFQNQQNDFAGRGLLQSSGYATANDNLTRSLNDQLNSTNTAKQSFLDTLAQQQRTFLSDNQNQVQQAKIDALARMAAGVSPVAV